MSGDNAHKHNVSIYFSVMIPQIERRAGAGAMGLYLLDMMFSIFRGHIPGSAARTATPAAIPPGAFMGVLAAATLAVALLAMSLWAVVWLAIRLI